MESSISYCDDVCELPYGAGRDAVSVETGGQQSISRHDVREYYISRDIALTSSSANDVEVPHFSLQSSALQLELPTSSTLPLSAKLHILNSDLAKFQLQWCLESSIKNDVVHNFSQGLYSVTYLSSKFAVPKSRVVEVIGLGLTDAAREFTLPQWETASALCLEVIRYSNARCSFLVSFARSCLSFPFVFNVSFPFTGMFSPDLSQRRKGSN